VPELFESTFAAHCEDALVGKTLRIQAGQWKVFLGTVCDATATHVHVELHSCLNNVMVVCERVTSLVPLKIMMAPTTPFVSGGMTPMHGGATPLHGGATLMHDNMGSDEVWRGGDEVWRWPPGEIYQFAGKLSLGKEVVCQGRALMAAVMRAPIPGAEAAKVGTEDHDGTGRCPCSCASSPRPQTRKKLYESMPIAYCTWTYGMSGECATETLNTNATWVAKHSPRSLWR
jgi:hypothetical protein